LNSSKPPLALSGERFTAVYRLAVEAAEVEARARAIGLEQTVEFPEALIPSDAIREQIVGEIAAITPCTRTDGGSGFEVSIRYPVEAAGSELTQLLNVLFGNVALQPGVRLQRIELPPALLEQFRGPRFGIAGLRRALVPDPLHPTGTPPEAAKASSTPPRRPLLCTALKPMGLSPSELAELAYRLTLGGIDLIKDDHGLADQPFCRFDERVARCAEAVHRANQETGGHSLYLPNVTAPAPAVMARAQRAKADGAGGLLFCPGLAGLDLMRVLADDDALALPILSHPALFGGLAINPGTGIAHGLLFATLLRLAGADATIFPHSGGRFTFTASECQEIADAAQASLGTLQPIWPVPAGGMRLERVPELVDSYGSDSIFLIGGDLHAGPDLVERCQAFRALVERSADGSVIDGHQ
jgi:ribulose-bisphosphate carboxylase large chain